MTHVLHYGPVTLDPVTHTAAVNAAPLILTATEYRLLEFLLRRAEAIVTRDQLAQHVWGGEYDPMSNNADVYIGYLRRKTEESGGSRLIHTVRGVGYALRDA